MSDVNPFGSSDTSGSALSCTDAIESNYYVVKTALFSTHPTYTECDPASSGLAWPGLAPPFYPLTQADVSLRSPAALHL